MQINYYAGITSERLRNDSSIHVTYYNMMLSLFCIFLHSIQKNTKEKETKFVINKLKLYIYIYI